ncbi:3',5'-cyclic AMP phosphodiesterase CpdA [Amycolatopsis bartoniae]|nr:metallophosphoesterase [Amycolatopsis bartoniae]MBB2937830.1 3',5'-cyclic AMP phosphodiesterase CpdA [Amycolatopsis bartoniae]TVT06506.1 metallophosphatase [Amycolatopsis bartoniae]
MTTMIQISDTHLSGDGHPEHGLVDTAAVLESALGKVLASGVDVKALLLTGDLADEGAPQAYRRLRELVEPAAEKLGARLIYAMGNHDERAAFHTELLSTVDKGSVDAVHWIDGLRVVVLDSTTPGRHEGRLEPEQLEWLRRELATPAPLGTVLVVHHPPLPSPVPTVHLLRLRDSAALAGVLRCSDVGMVLTGHAHRTGCGALAGVPVWVSPAIAYRVDALPPRARLRGVTGSGFSRIDLIDGVFVATALDLGPATPAYEHDEAGRLRLVRAATGLS